MSFIPSFAVFEAGVVAFGVTKMDEEDDNTRVPDVTFGFFGAKGVSWSSVLEVATVCSREPAMPDEDGVDDEWRCRRAGACRGVAFALLGL